MQRQRHDKKAAIHYKKMLSHCASMMVLRNKDNLPGMVKACKWVQIFLVKFQIQLCFLPRTVCNRTWKISQRGSRSSPGTGTNPGVASSSRYSATGSAPTYAGPASSSYTCATSAGSVPSKYGFDTAGRPGSHVLRSVRSAPPTRQALLQ